MLEDTAGGADCWQPIYDELLSGLAREGVEIERYRFVTNPERCLRSDGHAVPFGELVDHADALIMIGDGDAAVDSLDGHRAGWLASLRQIPRRLWINPVLPVRWSVGAREIAEETPMEHGVARAVAALHAGGEHRRHRARPYPGVIERAPDTASAVAGLRAALGDPAFHLVSAVAVTAPPTLAAARWLAEVLALELDEKDWLAVATLPWFRAGAWPDGLRDRLSQALAAGPPDFARVVATVADDRLAASEPPRGSAAHLVWQLEGAERAARRGERRVADRSLRRVAATPLADQARRARAALGLPDRARRARGEMVRGLGSRTASSRGTPGPPRARQQLVPQRAQRGLQLEQERATDARRRLPRAARIAAAYSAPSENASVSRIAQRTQPARRARHTRNH